MINPNGISASIIDFVRRAGRRKAIIGSTSRSGTPATASQVGQVFGVAIDNEKRAEHLPVGDLGVRPAPYRPTIRNGSPACGAPAADRERSTSSMRRAAISRAPSPMSPSAAGQTAAPPWAIIAYDRWNQQLFVSDLETGMIHRIRASDGTDLGLYDHGAQGRANFMDAESKQQRSLTPDSLQYGVAGGNRRLSVRSIPVFTGMLEFRAERSAGLGARRRAGRGRRRSPACTIRFRAARTWERPRAGTPCRTTRSETRCGRFASAPTAAFDTSSIRREFTMPDFFFSPQDVARAGLSRPVSDISFPVCTDRPVMLLPSAAAFAISGWTTNIRSPRRTSRARFATSSIRTAYGARSAVTTWAPTTGWPRALRTCLRTAPAASPWLRLYARRGRWTSVRPTSSCGSAAISCARPRDLCSARDAGGTQAEGDPSEVHGIQGMKESTFGELAPAAAFIAAQAIQRLPGELQSALTNPISSIPTSMSMPDGNVIEDELTRNDGTKIGDIAIFEVCEGRPSRRDLSR